jgi:hypothetical protein
MAVFWAATLCISELDVSEEYMAFISATETNRVILFREIVAVYCENSMKQIYSAGKTQF